MKKVHHFHFSAVPGCFCTGFYFPSPAAAVYPRALGRCLLLFCPRPWLIRRTTPCLLASSFPKRRKRLWLQRKQPLTLCSRNVGHSAVSVRRLGHFGRNADGHHDTGGRSGLRVRLLYGVGSSGGPLSASLLPATSGLDMPVRLRRFPCHLCWSAREPPMVNFWMGCPSWPRTSASAF